MPETAYTEQNNFDYPIKYNQYKLERDIGNACLQ